MGRVGCYSKIMKKNVVVFFGGVSLEHEISILTGVQVLNALKDSLYNPIPVFVTDIGDFYTGDALFSIDNFKKGDLLVNNLVKVELVKTGTGVFLRNANKYIFRNNKKVECGVLAFHGQYGEGGFFQGFCEVLGLPYTSSSVAGSVMTIDKVVMKKILLDSGVNVISGYEYRGGVFSEDVKYPVFVKPATGGSSIGVSRATNKNELERALEVAFALDSKVLVEGEFHKDSEVNIALLGSWDGEVEISAIEEVYSEGEFLDFDNKYLKGSKSKKGLGAKGMASVARKIPAELPNDLENLIIAQAKKAFKVLQCSGVVRIDFLVNKKTKEFVLVEVNSIPGSFAYYLFEPKGVPFTNLVEKMIEIALGKNALSKGKFKRFPKKIFINRD